MMEEKRKVFQITTDYFVYFILAMTMLDALILLFEVDDNVLECVIVDPKEEVILDEDNEYEEITLAEYIERDIVVSDRPVILASKEVDE